jgi:hypothetical protein
MGQAGTRRASLLLSRALSLPPPSPSRSLSHTLSPLLFSGKANPGPWTLNRKRARAQERERERERARARERELFKEFKEFLIYAVNAS